MRVASVAAVVSAVLVFLVRTVWGVNYFEDGIVASSAQFLLGGQLPYRDFWLPYGPLMPALAGAIFALTGPSVLVFQILTAVVAGAVGLVGGALVAPRSRLSAAVVAGVIPIIASVGATSMGIWALLPALATLLSARAEASPERDRLTGLFLAATALTRPDFGAYTLLSLLVIGIRRSTVIWAAIVTIPVGIGLLLLVPLDLLAEQFIGFPSIQAGFRSLPLPNPFAMETSAKALTVLIFHYLPALALAFAVAFASASAITRWEAGLAVFAGLMFIQGFQRADGTHAAQAAIPLVIVFAVLIRPRVRTPIGQASAAMLAIVIAAAAIRFWPDLVPVDGSYRDEVATTQAVLDVADPDRAASVAVLLPDNRATPVNANLLYLELRREPATRYTLFNPGLTDRPEVQQVIVHELSGAEGPVFVVLSEVPGWDPDANVAATTPRSDILDQYLRGGGWTMLLNGDQIDVLERISLGSP